MAQRAESRRRLLLRGGAVFLFLATGSIAVAETHIIEFGGSLGLIYSPSSLTVAVGDTIEWQGDFSFHPLSSTTIPAGAASWHNGTGTVFDYVVTVAGTYNYQCDVHGGSGMVGSFTAIVSGVNDDPNVGGPSSAFLNQNFPNPFNPTTTIGYGLPHTSTVRLTVYNDLGQPVAVLVQGEQEAGYHEVRFDASSLASGVYLYRLQADGMVQTRRLLLLK